MKTAIFLLFLVCFPFCGKAADDSVEMRTVSPILKGPEPTPEWRNRIRSEIAPNATDREMVEYFRKIVEAEVAGEKPIPWGLDVRRLFAFEPTDEDLVSLDSILYRRPEWMQNPEIGNRGMFFHLADTYCSCRINALPFDRKISLSSNIVERGMISSTYLGSMFLWTVPYLQSKKGTPSEREQVLFLLDWARLSSNTGAVLAADLALRRGGLRGRATFSERPVNEVEPDVPVSAGPVDSETLKREVLASSGTTNQVESAAP